MKSILHELLATEMVPGPLSVRDTILGWLAFAILAVIVILLTSAGTEEDEVL